MSKNILYQAVYSKQKKYFRWMGKNIICGQKHQQFLAWVVKCSVSLLRQNEEKLALICNCKVV